MTENTDPTTGPASRHTPKRQRATLGDLTYLVRPPNKPDLVRAFTAAERDIARDYAAEHHAVLEDLH